MMIPRNGALIFGVATLAVYTIYIFCDEITTYRLFATETSSHNVMNGASLGQAFVSKDTADSDSEQESDHKPFNVDHVELEKFIIKPEQYVNKTPSVMQSFVFVTGVSSSHFSESRDTIAGVQYHFPGRKILYFDWGLKHDQIHELKHWCNVELRKFNFTEIPHLARLGPNDYRRYYPAKLFVIILALKDYPAVVWMDSSVRYLHHNMSAIYDFLGQNDGFALLAGGAGTSTFAVTPPQMYKYFPLNETKLKENPQYMAGCMFFVRTKEVCEKVIWKMLLCCLDHDCIFGGDYQVHCAFQDKKRHLDRDVTFSNCTRTDQSLMNLIGLQLYNYDVYRYALDMDGTFLRIMGMHTNMHTLQIC